MTVHFGLGPIFGALPHWLTYVQYEKTVWEEELKQALVIALQSIQNRGPQIDLLTDSTQVEKNIIQLFQQQNQV